MYENPTDGCSKIGRSNFKYKDKHVFVNVRNEKATQGLWDLLTKSKPFINVLTIQHKYIN